MRDVVTDGTGRSLRSHSSADRREDRHGGSGRPPVARMVRRVCSVRTHVTGSLTGSRGSRGACKKKRIAFAIVIEHAGYGGITAAPAAGDIVSAATAVGLIGAAEK